MVTDKADDLPRKITFSKVNLGGVEVAGAEIEIYQGDTVTGAPVEKWTSGTTPKELDLVPGTYVFHEKAAPNGLLKVTNITFQVNLDGTVVVTNIGEKDAKGEDNMVVAEGAKITITDKTDDLPRKITFSKVNLGGSEIGGALIQIFNKAGEKVAEWTSVEGQSQDINLVPGVYVFHEEAAPNGYLAVTDITFQVNYDGTVTVVDTNSNAVEYVNGKLVITDQFDATKTRLSVVKRWNDKNDADKLRPKSIEVQLYANGEVVKGQRVTLSEKNKWQYVFVDLEEKKDGKVIKYSVQEVDVPKGYTVKYVDVDNYNKEIINSHDPKGELPKTGETLMTWTTVIGVTLLTGAAGYIAYKRKRQ